MIHDCLMLALALLSGTACHGPAMAEEGLDPDAPVGVVAPAPPVARWIVPSDPGVDGVVPTLATPPDTIAGDDAVAPRGPHPTLATDLALVGGGTVLVALLNPDVRGGVFEEGSLGHVVDNFRSPIRRALEGGREDDDHFVHNRIAHPLTWGGLGYYLRERGYSRRDALLFTQAHSVLWEYVIEGSFQKPSAKDLATNFTASAAAVYLLHGRLSPSAEPPGVQLRVGL